MRVRKVVVVLLVALLCVLAPQVALAKKKRQKRRAKQNRPPNRGSRAAKMETMRKMKPTFICTACERLSVKLEAALSRRHFAEDTWSEETEMKIWADLRSSCVDVKLFPKGGDLYIQGCIDLYEGYYGKIMEEMEKRLDPESDLYEEDLGAAYFCQTIGACNENTRSLDFALADSKLRGDFDMI